MIWLIVFLSFLMGYALANAAYYSDILARQQQRKAELGAYAGWVAKRLKHQHGPQCNDGPCKEE